MAMAAGINRELEIINSSMQQHDVWCLITHILTHHPIRSGNHTYTHTLDPSSLPTFLDLASLQLNHGEHEHGEAWVGGAVDAGGRVHLTHSMGQGAKEHEEGGAPCITCAGMGIVWGCDCM